MSTHNAVCQYREHNVYVDVEVAHAHVNVWVNTIYEQELFGETRHFFIIGNARHVIFSNAPPPTSPLPVPNISKTGRMKRGAVSHYPHFYCTRLVVQNAA